MRLSLSKVKKNTLLSRSAKKTKISKIDVDKCLNMLIFLLEIIPISLCFGRFDVDLVIKILLLSIQAIIYVVGVKEISSKENQSKKSAK